MPGISPDQKPVEREEWGHRRRFAAWVNFFLMTLFLLGSLVFVNLMARRKFFRLDLTSERAFELSDSTLRVLKDLERDVTIYLVPPQNPETFAADQALNNAWGRIQILANEYHNHNPSHLKFVTVTENDKEAINEIRKYFKDLAEDVIYFVSPSEDGKRVNTRALQVRPPQFYDGNPNTGQIDNFYGEHWITLGIQFVTFSKKRVIYTSIGHQELLHQNSQQYGMSVLAQLLLERENVELSPIDLKVMREIPPNGEALLIAGPTEPFTDEELNLLREYLEQGHSVFIALQPKSKTGLESFLEAWGARVGDNVVRDTAQNVYRNWDCPIITIFGKHDINYGMEMGNSSIPLAYACTVEPAPKHDPKLQVGELMKTSPSSWESKGALVQHAPHRNPDERMGPLCVAVAVETKVEKPAEGREKARLVVWGSAMSLSNSVLRYRGMEPSVEYVLNNFRWLMEQKPSFTIPGKHSGRKPPELSLDARTRLQIVTVVGFPLLGVLLGILAWFFRRK